MSRVPPSRYVCFLLLTTSGLIWDLYTKEAVFIDLGYPGGVQNPLVAGQHALFNQQPGTEGETVPYIKGWLTFRLFTSFNRGALWGIGQQHTWLFASLSVVAGLGVVYWLFGRGAAVSWWLTISLSFILSGTLGNLYDRMAWHGYLDVDGEPIHAVRDFLLFTFGGFHWPVFNFADVSLVTGAIMLVLHSLFVPVPESSPIETETQQVEDRATSSAT